MANNDSKQGLSNYFVACAEDSAKPKFDKPDVSSLKQGKVVRLESDVSKVQAWAGMQTERRNEGRMTVDTRQAIQQKIADYQRENNIEVAGQNPAGHINAATLDAMRNDPNVPKEVVESLAKVKNFMVYSKEITSEAICKIPDVTDNQGFAPVQTPEEIANAARYDSLNLSKADAPPSVLAKNQAEALGQVLTQYQKGAGLPETGRFDNATLDQINNDPNATGMKEQYKVWDNAGLITNDGKWDQQREVQIRLGEWDARSNESSLSAPAANTGLNRLNDSFNIQSQINLTQDFKEANLSMIPLDKRPDIAIAQPQEPQVNQNYLQMNMP